MEAQKQIRLNFRGVDFPHVNSTLINPIDKSEQPQLEVKIIPKVFLPEDKPNEFTIIFDVNIGVKNFFSIAVIAFGFFEFADPLEDILQRKAFINVNAPAIMFPYVRSFLSTFTANLGGSFSPILLPPHFFTGELEEYKMPVQATAAP